MLVRTLLVVAVLSLFVPASFGQEGEIKATLDSDVYHTGDELTLSGTVGEQSMPVIAVSIFDPDETILLANNVNVAEDGTFSKTISLDSPFYDAPGTDSIKLDYGKLTHKLTFDIAGESSTADTSESETLPEVVSLTTEKSSYTDNEIIKIHGAVSSLDSPSVLVGIYDPSKMPAGFYFGEVDSNLEFSVSFPAKEGVNFKSEGTYSVEAHYGESTATTTFVFTQKTNDDVEKKESNGSKAASDNGVSQENKGPKDDGTTKSKKDTSKSNPPAPNKPPKEKSIPDKNKADDKQREPNYYDNLSVEDVKLGTMLNEMLLSCDDGKYDDLISYYNGMGPALIRLCKYSEAIHYFDQSLQQNPDDVEALTNKGVALNKLGHHENALSSFNKALQINPEYILALNNKANVLATMGDYQHAIQIYKTATKIDPHNDVLKSNLASITYLDYEPEGNPSETSQDARSSDREPEPPPPPPEKTKSHSARQLDKINNAKKPSTSIDEFKGFLYGLGKQLLDILAQ